MPLNENDMFVVEQFHQGNKTHLIISWDNSSDFNPDQLNKDRINLISLLVDISSSMNYVLGATSYGYQDFSRLESQNTRINIVKRALGESLEVLERLILDGVPIALNIITFCSEAKKVYPTGPGEYFKTLIPEDFEPLRETISSLRPRGGTSISRAISLAESLVVKQNLIYDAMDTPPERRYLKIMCSDGEDTCSYRHRNEQLGRDFENGVDVAIGVGSACDYKQDVLVALATGGDFISAPDEKTFVENFVSRIFFATTLTASQVQLELDPNVKVDSGLPLEDGCLQIGDFQSYRHLMITVEKKEEHPCGHLKLHYHLEKANLDASREIEVIFRETEKTPIGKLLNVYSNCTQELSEIADKTFQHPEYVGLSEGDQMVWLRKYLSKKIIELKEAIQFAREHKCSIQIISMTEGTLKELEKVQKAQRSSEYMADLYTSSRVASTGLCSTSSYMISRVYSAREPENDPPNLDCLICMTASRQVVAGPCRHLVSCIPCMSTMKSQGMGCPVCKQRIEVLYEVMTPTLKDDPHFLCQICKNVRIQTFNSPCQHATFCDGCRTKARREDQTLICPAEGCGVKVTKTRMFYRP